jgi:hypothetical protein
VVVAVKNRRAGIAAVCIQIGDEKLRRVVSANDGIRSEFRRQSDRVSDDVNGLTDGYLNLKANCVPINL